MDDPIDALAQEALTYSAEHRRQFLREACPSTEVLEAVRNRIEALQVEEGETDPSSGQAEDGSGSDAAASGSPPRTRPLPGSDWPTVPYRPDAAPEGADASSSASPTEPLPGSDWPTIPHEGSPDWTEEGAVGAETDGPSEAASDDAGMDRTRTEHRAGDSTTLTQESVPSPERGDPNESSDRVDRIGPWRLVEVLGQGGMGAVYLAERADGQFQQQAALKLIRHDLGPDAQKRFLSERQILAQLQHPNIAHLLDGGVTEDGRPYFAMEYVDGTPIDTYCNEHGLSVEERLRLFQQVARAVQFAHSNLIVHRDVKPSNILVAEPSTDSAGPAAAETGTLGFTGGSGPQVKLLDFGIAKALEGAEGIDSYTQTGEGNPLTPSYAAPEQVQGATITTATDVYAMGVVLCELLSGRLPYDVRGRSPAEVTRIITETEPTPPSELVEQHSDTAVVGAFGLSAEALQQRLQGDLDVIVQKALRKEPDRRYTSATDLGKDVDRHLEGLPVEARPATTGYRLRRFVARNRTTVLSAAGAVVALLVGLGVAIWQAQVAASQRDRAQQNAERAEAVQTFLVDMIGRAAPATTGGEALTMREVLDEAEVELEEGAMQNQPNVSIDVRTTIAEMYRLLDRNGAAVEQSGKAYESSRETFGAEHPQTFKAAGAFGRSLFQNGEVERADSLFEAVVPKLESSEASPEVRAFLLTRYGGVLKEETELDKAENTLLQALDWHQRASRLDTLELTRTLNELGNVYRLQGVLPEQSTEGGAYNSKERFQRAEEKLQRALRLSEARNAPKQKLMLKEVMNDMALLYKRMGEMNRAEEMYHQSLDLAKTLYDEESGPVARTLINLSVALRDQGKLQESDSLSARAVDLSKTVYGPSHYVTGLAMNHRAETLFAQGRYENAGALMEEVRALFKENFGPAHPYTVSAHRGLFKIYQKKGELKEALQHGRSALKANRSRLDDTATGITSLQRGIGEIYTEQGRYEEAEELLLTALRAQEKAGDEEQVEMTRESLAKLYEAWPQSDREEVR